MTQKICRKALSAVLSVFHRSKLAALLTTLAIAALFSTARPADAGKPARQEALKPSLADQSPLANSHSIPSTPVDPSRSVTLTGFGSAETVFHYTTDHCDPYEIPDAPARAFRDAQGTVNLVVGIDTTRRWVGASLDSVVHQCPVVYDSHRDIQQMNSRYREWFLAPYTVDGLHVYTIIHNEWYGNLIAGSQCGADDQVNGWVNASTLAASHDGGATFIQPSDYIIRFSTTPFSPSFPCTAAHPTRYGYDLFGTNIVAKDGYYYRFADYISDPGTPFRHDECLMRTQDVSSASAWETWMGNDYIKSKTTPCQAVANLSTNIWSLTYNTYLHLYVAVGGGSADWIDPGEFFFQTSPDLMTWSSPVNITGIDSIHVLEYPSLIDPADTSRNFENTGQMPYLYYSRVNKDGTRDLVRAQVKFAR